MEIVKITREYREIDGEFKFFRRKLILEKDSTFFYAYTFEPRQRIKDVKIDELDLHPIPNEEIYPSFVSGITLAPDPLPDDCYIKRPGLQHYNPDAPVGRRLSDIVIEEIQVCETLKRHPHINIAEYFGCTIRNNHVDGLVFTKYPITLAARLKDTDRPLHVEACLSGIEDGLAHLHGLGLIHNDINPENIMLREDDTPVLIDFNTCQRDGEVCRSAGSGVWSPAKMDLSIQENDYYGLSKIKEGLVSGQMLRNIEPSR
jgi:serine/threonine protein kinase